MDFITRWRRRRRYDDDDDDDASSDSSSSSYSSSSSSSSSYASSSSTSSSGEVDQGATKFDWTPYHVRATKIQSLYRGYLVRTMVKIKKHAATIIARTLRRYIERKKRRRKFDESRRRRAYRLYHQQKRDELERIAASVSIIQRQWRVRLHKRKEHAAAAAAAADDDEEAAAPTTPRDDDDGSPRTIAIRETMTKIQSMQDELTKLYQSLQMSSPRPLPSDVDSPRPTATTPAATTRHHSMRRKHGRTLLRPIEHERAVHEQFVISEFDESPRNALRPPPPTTYPMSPTFVQYVMPPVMPMSPPPIQQQQQPPPSPPPQQQQQQPYQPPQSLFSNAHDDDDDYRRRYQYHSRLDDQRRRSQYTQSPPANARPYRPPTRISTVEPDLPLCIHWQHRVAARDRVRSLPSSPMHSNQHHRQQQHRWQQTSRQRRRTRSNP